MTEQSAQLSVFVVMPFADEFKDRYELAIKQACLAAGATCARVDEQLFLENILERIYDQIRNADVVVAEMTGRSQNVFYEVGYAHGVGTPVILVTSDASDIPFDLKHYPHVVYSGQLRTLRTELEKKISWCIKNRGSLKKRDSFRSLAGNGFDQMGEQIVNYFEANQYTKASFDRIEKLMGFPESQVRALIQQQPHRFRYSLLKGNKPGIGLV